MSDRSNETGSDEKTQQEMSDAVTYARTRLSAYPDPIFIAAIGEAITRLGLKGRAELPALRAIPSIVCNLQSLADEALKVKNPRYKDILSKILEEQQAMALATVSDEENKAIENFSRNLDVLTCPMLVENCRPENNLGISDFRCDQDQIAKHLKNPNEVGGIMGVQRKGNIFDVDFVHTDTGDERSVAVKQKPYGPKEIGVWHSHTGKSGFPIPSGNDLTTPYFYFNLQPNAILGSDESRIYLPRLHYEVLDDSLKERCAVYEPADRKQELMALGVTEELADYANNLCVGLHYLKV